MSATFAERAAVLRGDWSPEGLRLVADTLEKLKKAHAEAYPKEDKF